MSSLLNDGTASKTIVAQPFEFVATVRRAISLSSCSSEAVTFTAGTGVVFIGCAADTLMMHGCPTETPSGAATRIEKRSGVISDRLQVLRAISFPSSSRRMSLIRYHRKSFDSGDGCFLSWKGRL